MCESTRVQIQAQIEENPHMLIFEISGNAEILTFNIPKTGRSAMKLSATPHCANQCLHFLSAKFQVVSSVAEQSDNISDLTPLDDWFGVICDQ